MTCYSPLVAQQVGIKEDGKKDIRILKRHKGMYYEKGKIYEYSTQYDHVDGQEPNPVKKVKHLTVDNALLLPCGQCLGCRIDRSRDWANRMMLELKDHETASFITLTYNEDNVPRTIDMNGNEQLTLLKRDWQLFMKRLRKRLGKKIRFYAVGEYGSKTLRPHYHAIIYGEDFKDSLVYLRSTNLGYPQFKSTLLEEVWNYGFNLVERVTWETCAYCARYITKKYLGKLANYYDYFNIEPEFSLMSRRPGIARSYYDEYKEEIYKYQQIDLATKYKGMHFKPPKYYDKLYDIDYPEDMARIKEQRREMSDNVSYEKVRHSNLSYFELLEVERQNFEAKIKGLRRDAV